MNRTSIHPQMHDLGGGFIVRRLLPAAQRRAVGPFVFFDHFGPVSAGPADDHDVRPHPHIGLATLSYLFEGALLHRDSLGTLQRIEPGAVNWMSAGRGIVHSERTPDDLRGVTRRSHGLQLWLALPAADEEMAPAFAHTAAADLPELEVGGATLRLLVGSAFGATSPVAAHSPTLCVDITLREGDGFPLPLAAERALYSVAGGFELDGQAIAPQQLVLIEPGDEPMISGSEDARVMLIGGAALGQRHMRWNFVSSRPERIAQAAADWVAGRFPAVPGDSEFMPMPASRPA
ncbi:MAG: pirin family protein [Rubrivivax sp.]|nr:pirin family protein [Rubrivivax sp.]